MPDRGDGVKGCLVGKSRLGKSLEKRTCILASGLKRTTEGPWDHRNRLSKGSLSNEVLERVHRHRTLSR